MLHAVTTAGRVLVEVFNFSLGAPLMTLPRAFWSRKSQHQLARLALSLLPLAVIGLVIWAAHFTARVDAVPSRLPAHIMGLPGPRVLAFLHGARSVLMGLMVQYVYLRDGVTHILAQMSAEVTLLLFGALLWVQLLIASTVLLGPVHVLMLSPLWQQRVKRGSAQMLAPLNRLWDNLWRLLADKRHLWFVGTDVERNEPLFVNLETHRATWILGGAGRRAAALPLLSELRTIIQSGRGLLFIDTVDNVGLASELQAFAHAAGRAKDFEAVHVSGDNAEAFVAHAEDIQRQKRVVYLGLPMHTKSLELQEAAKRIVIDLVELSRRNQDNDPNALCVAIQDARELPLQAMAHLSEETGLRLLIAQQTCDSDHLSQLVASLKSHERHVVLCLAVARGVEASNLAHALVHVSLRRRKDPMTMPKPADGGAAVLSTQMIQALRSNEAHVMIDGELGAHVVRLSSSATPPKHQRAATTAGQETFVPPSPQ